MNAMEIGNMNRNRIFRYILEKRQASILDISRELSISVPTITQHVTVLMEKGLLFEDGQYKSTGGRRARVIACNPHSKVAFGFNISHRIVDLIAVDLLGNVIDYIQREEECAIDNDLIGCLKTMLMNMIKKNKIMEQSIVGVGVSLPAIIDSNGVIYDTAFNQPLPQNFQQLMQEEIGFPISYFNDASSGGYAEFWHRKLDENLFYLSLSSTVGGAARIHGRVYDGNSFRSAEIGHTTIIPNGRLCYCGQRGCMNTYCSSNNLIVADGSLGAFFQRLECGDEESLAKWEEYIDYLAIAINNIRMLFDCDIILGGSVGRYIPQYIQDLTKRLSARDSFHRSTDYIRVCEYHSESSSVGAALMLIDRYIELI